MSETNVKIKDVVLKRADEVSNQEISLFVMAKNAESVIVRLLNNVGPYIHEVVMVLNDTTDRTKTLVSEWCRENNKPFIYVEITAESHPDLYILDTATTYDVGRPLNNEAYTGPFTEVEILADWSSARNLGWGLCTKPWRLFLDADDVVSDPECLPGLCQALDDSGVEIACTAYHFRTRDDGTILGKSYRERLARNEEYIRWVYPIHEVIHGTSFICHVVGNLIVTDRRDSTGTGIRIPGRNFKILYQQARSGDWDVNARVLVYLLVEVRYQVPEDDPANLLIFAESLYGLYMKRSDWPEERAWACALMGEMYELCADKRADLALEKLEKAKTVYLCGLEEHQSSKLAFRLCRVYHKIGDWKKCVDAYQKGIEYQANVRQVLDDGPVFVDMSKILVASAYGELGMYDEAVILADEALKVFPTNDALVELAAGLRRMNGERAADEAEEDDATGGLCPDCGYGCGDQPCGSDFHK